MYVLGITGSIGSGKTTVSSILSDQGAVVSHSDDLAKELIQSDPSVRDDICRQFGADIYDETGILQTSLLARRAFDTPEHQHSLNSIVHPAVGRVTRERMDRARTQGIKLFIIDAPLLLDAGVNTLTDSVLVVAAESNIRQKRVALRSGLESLDFMQRDALQMPQEEKIAKADHVIWNNGDRAALKAAVMEFYLSLNL